MQRGDERKVGAFRLVITPPDGELWGPTFGEMLPPLEALANAGEARIRTEEGASLSVKELLRVTSPAGVDDHIRFLFLYGDARGANAAYLNTHTNGVRPTQRMDGEVPSVSAHGVLYLNRTDTGAYKLYLEKSEGISHSRLSKLFTQLFCQINEQQRLWVNPDDEAELVQPDFDITPLLDLTLAREIDAGGYITNVSVVHSIAEGTEAGRLLVKTKELAMYKFVEERTVLNFNRLPQEIVQILKEYPKSCSVEVAVRKKVAAKRYTTRLLRFDENFGNMLTEQVSRQATVSNITPHLASAVDTIRTDFVDRMIEALQ